MSGYGTATLPAVIDQAPRGTGDPAYLRFMREYQQAVAARELREPLYRQLYRYMLPLNAPLFGITIEDAFSQIYEDTGLRAAEEFASRLQSGIAPFFQHWAKLRAGWEIPLEYHREVNALLHGPSRVLFSILENSNFFQELDLALKDGGCGTAILSVDSDEEMELRFRAEPAPMMAVHDGPDGEPERIFRCRELPLAKIQLLYPDGIFPEPFERRLREKPDAVTKLIEGCRRDRGERLVERWVWQAAVPEFGDFIDERLMEGTGSCPWVVFRWSRVVDSPWGGGPFVNVLPNVKSLNYLVELTFQGVELAVGGMWQYDNDGMLNPNTVQLVPRALIPRAPGSRGLEALKTEASFDVAQLQVIDLREQVKSGLFLDRLGPVDGAVKSATEILERQAELARIIGAPYTRLQRFLREAARRSVYLLTRRGTLTLPSLNGRRMTMQNIGPFARGQRLDEVMNVDNFLGMISQRFGPEAAMLVVKLPELSHWMADQLDIDPGLLNGRQEIGQAIQTAVAATQQAQAA